MAVWLVRAGKLGEHETKFVEELTVYCTLGSIDWDMSMFSDRDMFKDKVRQTYPDTKDGTLNSHVGQMWRFSHEIAIGDVIALPSKIKPAIYFFKVESDYTYNAENAEDDIIYRHLRKVKLIKEVRRSDIDQDILYSLGSVLTICKIERNNAEQRIRTLLDQSLPKTNQTQSIELDDDEVIDVDIEETAIQGISDRLIAKFKGHGLSKIVASILEAKGFTTHISPPGRDDGVDILASRGSLGFESPKICVQVKSQDTPIDRSVHDQLIGTMRNHKADYGLLVAWGGFKSSITKEKASHFFEVRLWSHKEVVQEFLRHYEDLPEDIRETIPLKRIWVIDKSII